MPITPKEIEVVVKSLPIKTKNQKTRNNSNNNKSQMISAQNLKNTLFLEIYILEKNYLHVSDFHTYIHQGFRMNLSHEYWKTFISEF